MFIVAMFTLAKQLKQPVSNNRGLNYGASSVSIKIMCRQIFINIEQIH